MSSYIHISAPRPSYRNTPCICESGHPPADALRCDACHLPIPDLEGCRQGRRTRHPAGSGRMQRANLLLVGIMTCYGRRVSRRALTWEIGKRASLADTQFWDNSHATLLPFSFGLHILHSCGSLVFFCLGSSFKTDLLSIAVTLLFSFHHYTHTSTQSNPNLLQLQTGTRAGTLYSHTSHTSHPSAFPSLPSYLSTLQRWSLDRLPPQQSCF